MCLQILGLLLVHINGFLAFEVYEKWSREVGHIGISS